jgi:3-phenylpropionate/trans-cinnamate dioxygenase ferredoxin reductase subunit
MATGMVIVGGGECGVRAALALRELGYAGSVTLIGEETHLPYERPPLSKGAIADAEAPLPKTIATHDRLSAAGIEMITGNPALGLDPAGRVVELSDGASVRYEKLLLATGATPRKLPGAPQSALYLRTFGDAMLIRSRLSAGCKVAIVGGGFIGLELAASARMRGADVTVIEPQPRLLMRGVPEEIAASVTARHAAEGVDMLCGQGIARIEEAGPAVHIRATGGRELEVDLCVIGIGVIPSTALAQTAGLAIDNGIAVDEHLRTSDPDIFAAGDCCSFPLGIYDGRRVRLESWRNAQEQGVLAAANMIGGDQPHRAIPWFWSDHYDITVYVAGLPDEGRMTVRRDLGDGAFLLFHLAEDGRLVAASGVGPGNAVAREIRLSEMLIAKRLRPLPDQLGAVDVKLKTLLVA